MGANKKTAKQLARATHQVSRARASEMANRAVAASEEPQPEEPEPDLPELRGRRRVSAELAIALWGTGAEKFLEAGQATILDSGPEGVLVAEAGDFYAALGAQDTGAGANIKARKGARARRGRGTGRSLAPGGYSIMPAGWSSAAARAWTALHSPPGTPGRSAALGAFQRRRIS